jgi:GntP family gluconate:H+ symporter
MNPILILLVGMVVVIGGVLALRLHAFLALTLGALAVAALTPSEALYQNELELQAIEIVGIDREAGTITLKPQGKQKVMAGSGAVLDDSGEPQSIATTLIGKSPNDAKLVVLKVGGDAHFDVGDSYIHETGLAQAKKAASTPLGKVLADGFGSTCASIGILIAMAAIIGKCLLDSGGAERIVVGMRRALGEKRTPFVFLSSGFVVGIPVFFDTVFYLLLPLGKAMSVKSGRHYVLYVLTIVAGATMAHSLVPPTPGPLFVAGELGVDVGLMIIGGLVVGSISISAGYLYARWADKKWNIPLRPSAELDEAQLQAMANRDESQLPPLSLSLIPIVLPVVLIAGGTVVSMAGWQVPGVEVWSDKNVALMLAAAVSLGLLVRRTGLATMAPAVGNALSSGGVIILITAAGGAFGQALRQTGIASNIADLVPSSGSALLWLPIAFGITMMVRIAQGSATVAMITAVGIVAPVVAGGALGFNPLYLALAIGCGSKPIPWMNDSGFWIITKMSGFEEGETLKTASVMMSMMGFVGLIVTVLAAWLVPLV